MTTTSVGMWYRLDTCPTCDAKTGERCVRRTLTYDRMCVTPHKNRPYLSRYQRSPRK